MSEAPPPHQGRTAAAGAHRLHEVGVELEHVVELLLELCWLQSFVLIVLQEIRLRSKGAEETHHQLKQV